MLRYYSIHDNSLNLSNPPFSAPDDKSAVRMVRNMLVSADDAVFKRVFPVCDLLYVGSFDETRACFLPEGDAVLVVHLADIPIPDGAGGAV